jgi:hypothetical protein
MKREIMFFAVLTCVFCIGISIFGTNQSQDFIPDLKKSVKNSAGCSGLGLEKFPCKIETLRDWMVL